MVAATRPTMLAVALTVALAMARALAGAPGAVASPVRASGAVASAAPASAATADPDRAARRPAREPPGARGSLQARVPAGRVKLPYRPEEAEQGRPVAAFLLDRDPVTQGEFLGFVRREPRWLRGRASALFVDGSYLADWAAPDRLGDDLDPRSPVTRVSWFAAKAYCEARGARLPTEAEWEWAAGAGERGLDGRAEPGFTERILAWYGRPTPERLPPVGEGAPNFLGVRDLHGLVWEWVLDFNAALVTGDSREAGKAENPRWCGAGALGAVDRADYATFMRLAFRSALEARFTTANLGFRCASDAPAPRRGRPEANRRSRP